MVRIGRTHFPNWDETTEFSRGPSHVVVEAIAVDDAVTRGWLDLEDRDTISLEGTPPWVGG